MRILFEKNAFSTNIRFVIQDGPGRFAKPLKFDQHPAGSMPADTGSVSLEDAQQMMDNLWACGLRPTEGSGSAGALKATQYHLEDMRKLVEKLVELKLTQE